MPWSIAYEEQANNDCWHFCHRNPFVVCLSAMLTVAVLLYVLVTRAGIMTTASTRSCMYLPGLASSPLGKKATTRPQRSYDSPSYFMPKGVWLSPVEWRSLLGVAR